MKYLAILKDSFREALDSKVLYVMLVLSTLVILFVATLSFKPTTAQKTMDLFFPSAELEGMQLMYFILNNHEIRQEEGSLAKRDEELPHDHVVRQMRRVAKFKLEGVEQKKGEPDSPEGDYLLTIVEPFAPVDKDEDEAEILRKGKLRVREIFERADEFGLIRIGAIEAEQMKGQMPPGPMRYRVMLHGTPQTFRIWGHTLVILAWDVPSPPVPLGYQIYILSRIVILFGSWIAINVGVVVTAFFFPNMLSKGTVDMLLVKPINRWTLIVYKYIGGLSFIFLNGAYAIGGIWLVLGIRTGIWPTGCLLLVFSMTFFFAILYAISTYVSVVTRSTIASIMLTLLGWFVFFGVAWGHGKFEEISRAEGMMKQMGMPLADDERWGNGRLATSINFLYAVTPRTGDLNRFNDRIVYCDLVTGSVANMSTLNVTRQNWGENLTVAAVWIVVFLGIACVWFTYKDY